MNQYKQVWAANAGCLDTPTLRNIESQFSDKTSPLRVTTHLLALPVAAGIDKLAAGALTTAMGPTALAVLSSITIVALMTYFTWSFVDYYSPFWEWLLEEALA